MSVSMVLAHSKVRGRPVTLTCGAARHVESDAPNPSGPRSALADARITPSQTVCRSSHNVVDVGGADRCLRAFSERMLNARLQLRWSAGSWHRSPKGHDGRPLSSAYR